MSTTSNNKNEIGFIELHILQNFPPSNLNRDDLGQPKECDFGGYRRARISSQCQKRAIRTLPLFRDTTQVSNGVRTRLITRGLTTKLENLGRTAAESKAVVTAFAQAYAGDMKDEKTNISLYLSDDELLWVANQMHNQWKEFQKALSPETPLGTISGQLHEVVQQRTVQPGKGEAISITKLAAEVQARLEASGHPGKDAKSVASDFKKSFAEKYPAIKQLIRAEIDWCTEELSKQWKAIQDIRNAKSPLQPLVDKLLEVGKQTSAPDIALFGRMLAGKTNTNVDAACQVAHAISTHAVQKAEIDYFTVVDDLATKEETGAAFLDIAQFTSACFYRYARIDWRQLNENLRNKDWQDNDLGDLAVRTVEAFLRSAEAAVPPGKKNSHAQEVRPSFMLAVLRTPQSAGWSLVNAFQKPVQAKDEGDLVLASVKKLEKQFDHLVDFYGDESIRAFAIALPDGTVTKDQLGKNFQSAVRNYTNWIASMCEPLRKGA